jgi:hypothetical protein
MDNLNQSLGQFSGGFAGLFQELEQDLEQLEQDVEQIASELQGADPLTNSSGAGQGNGLGDLGDNSPGPFGQGDGGGDFCGPQQQPWSATNSGDGQGTINLGDGYTLQLNKANSGWTLTNNQTGAVTNASGDPHVSEDGQNWTFKNNTTFQLSDGTRVTVRTVPYGNGQTLSDEIDITRGHQSIKVTGLAQNDSNPLQITEGFNGRQLAASNFGDSVLYESGDQWRAWDGQVVDEQYAAANL